MSVWVWFIVYVGVQVFVPHRRHQRGYVWTLLRRLPPWRWVPGWTVLRCWLRHAMLWTLAFVGYWLLLPDWALLHALYLSAILVELDDYVNGGDDDRRKRREWACNKIRWLMELPAPRPAGDTA